MTVWTGKSWPWAPLTSLRTTICGCSAHPWDLWRTSTACPQKPTSPQAASGSPSSYASTKALQLGFVTLTE